MVCAGAVTIAKMLHGIAHSFLLEISRSWDVSKNISPTPVMANLTWKNSMTEEQFSNIQRNQEWINVKTNIVRS